MTTKATTNCVKYLLNRGLNFSDISVSNPAVSVRKFCFPSLKIGKHVTSYKFGRLVCWTLGWAEPAYIWFRQFPARDYSKSHKLILEAWVSNWDSGTDKTC